MEVILRVSLEVEVVLHNLLRHSLAFGGSLSFPVCVALTNIPVHAHVGELG